ncbi:MAG: hypothetical protein IJ877_06545 [Candidatus Gastranaerophilales bacterium]|nr:hypothetical protein [Candidatus Gastranaerophilales bacterium]
MENSAYNSLTQKLIQNGILPSENEENASNFFENTSTNPIIEEETEQKNKNKKRINQYDLDIIEKESISNTINFKTVALLKVLRRFIDFKENKAKKSNLKFENLFFKFFPKLYKAKLVKDAMNQLLELNIDAKTLLDKTIPYGESDTRYEDLIKYLNCANEIQTNLRKKI